MPKLSRPMLRPEAGVVLLLVVAILGMITMGGFAISLWLRTSEARQVDTTQQLSALREAIQGDPQEESFGYLGDMGALPLSLGDLIVKPARAGACTGTPIPNYATATTYGVGMGWRGPYLDRRLFHQIGSEETAFKDEWGTPLSYRIVDASLDASLPAGQRYAEIRSAGPDAESGTSDDLIADPVYEKGQLRMRIQMGSSTSGTLPMSVSARLWYACDGAESPTPLTSTTVNFSGSPGAEGFLEFPMTHHGPHAVLLTNGEQLREPSVVPVAGGLVTKTSLSPAAARMFMLVTYEFQCIPVGAPKGKTTQSAGSSPC